MNKTAKISRVFTAVIAAALFFTGLCAAEDKFLDRDPKPSSYSALCSFYRQEDLPLPAVSTATADFRGCNLSGFDFSAFPASFEDTAEFDASTAWPEENKLPKKFRPEKIMKKRSVSENTVNKIRKMTKGGKGLFAGIIGKPPLLSHSEYGNSIMSYRQQALSPLASREATAALSIVSGRNTGFVPDIQIYYVSPLSYGKTYGARDMFPESRALKRMLDLNASLPDGRKMKAMLLLYRDYDKAFDGMETLGKAKKMAKEQKVALFSGDDLIEFADYNIIPEKFIHAASPAGDNAMSYEKPSPEWISAYLLGLYLSALHYSPELSKEDFFWLLKHTAAFEKNKKKNSGADKKTLRPLKMIKIIKELGK